jgi:glutathione S-transferase
MASHQSRTQCNCRKESSSNHSRPHRKVVLLLKELSIPYEHKLWDFPDLKKDEYEALCPNGRTPTIEDPNTGITLWESGAILEYLIDTYDKDKKFTYTSSPEKYQLKQWYVGEKREKERKKRKRKNI